MIIGSALEISMISDLSRLMPLYKISSNRNVIPGLVLERYFVENFTTPVISVDKPIILIPLNGEAIKRVYLNGEIKEKKIYPGSVSVYPNGFSHSYEIQNELDFLVIYIRDSFFDDNKQYAVYQRNFKLTPKITFDDRFFYQTSNLLLSELQSESKHSSKFYLDSIKKALTLHLQKNYSHCYNPSGVLNSELI